MRTMPLLPVRIVPVLDVIGGQVVHAQRGERLSYRPLASTLTHSTDPIDVASAIRDEYGFSEIYCADLDAIEGKPPGLRWYGGLQQAGFSLWVDAGIREAADANPLAECRVDRIIAGLETLRGPDVLAELQIIIPAALVFSLDLVNGRPKGNVAAWLSPGGPGADPGLAIASRAHQAGVRRMIVLDLARVGTQSGPGTEDLCRRIAQAHLNIELIAGGGIQSAADLAALSAVGIHTALVATALHQPGFLGADSIPEA